MPSWTMPRRLSGWGAGIGVEGGGELRRGFVIGREVWGGVFAVTSRHLECSFRNGLTEVLPPYSNLVHVHTIHTLAGGGSRFPPWKWQRCRPALAGGNAGANAAPPPSLAPPPQFEQESRGGGGGGAWPMLDDDGRGSGVPSSPHTFRPTPPPSLSRNRAAVAAAVPGPCWMMMVAAAVSTTWKRTASIGR